MLLVALPVVVVLIVVLAVAHVPVVGLGPLVKYEEMEGLEMRDDHVRKQPPDSVFPKI